MIDFSNFDNVISITSYFNTKAKCREAIAEARWGKDDEQDVVCPYCGKHHCSKRKDGRYRCNGCLHNFSVTVGTIFEDSNLPLIKWFLAMYLISSHKKGISSHQLSRDLKVTQKTAWYVLQKVRALYKQDDGVAMSGEVELDEVYIGGKEKWKHKSMRTPNTQGRSTKTKTPIFGLMERTSIINKKGDREPMSYVHAIVVNKTDGETLLPIVQQFVADGSHVITDELTSYNRLGSLGYEHDVVKHSSDEYVKSGNIFTNNMEAFWSHFRRMVTGCYHWLSDEHLQAYVDEACYRWNTRKASQTERFSDMFNKSIGLIVTQDELKLCEVA